MNINAVILRLGKLRAMADWKLLLFLLLFMNVKLVLKIPAIVLIYLLRFDFRFGFSPRESRLPLFYPLVMLTGILAAVITQSVLKQNYLIVLSTGLAFWVLCVLAAHQVKLFVERNEPTLIHQTIQLFFLLNAMVSLVSLMLIIMETHAFNPYTYQGQYQKYFMNTGDYIKGLTFDTSTTNAVLNGFGVIYFLIRNKVAMLLLCTVVLLLTASNFINIALFAVLSLLFIFRSSRDQKSLIVVCLALFVVFIVKVSPQNKKMVLDSTRSRLHLSNPEELRDGPVLRLTERPDSSLNQDEKRQKLAMLYLDSVAGADSSGKVINNARVMLPTDDIHSAAFQHINTTPQEQKELPLFIKAHQPELPISGRSFQWSRLPGKVEGWLQTLRFLGIHPVQLIAGAGPGNFSSKLAFRATDLGFSGGYPSKYVYINRDFLQNHLDLYLNYFSRPAEFHSLINSPFSVYDQLLAEYGLLGMLAFIFFYAGFFIRDSLKLSYGLPLLVFTGLVLSIDYWFEQLSVMIFFELLLFLNMKETAVKLNNYGKQ